ncbi:mediator of RNA polymerase II transcription subunit 33A-like isoform X2 [Prosopis cineraria]|uniref:mediator of RNA polymerase II transcription subunit 33A-like isoform X2 n=1 Tax=Prosopis cineraria TaxID=364024 RepID=UPI00240EDCC5|nr:mediator of RNA polymerase II transcription subunit 33A-like isoform X2 [Prosopis cineraria]
MGSDCEFEWNEVKEKVFERVKLFLQRKEPPLYGVMELIECLSSLNVRLPSPELAELLVSHLCFDYNHPSLWKFLHQALSSRLLFPLQVLSLLSSRIIPHRHRQPEAYRLFLELLRQYAFSFDPNVADSCKLKIINSVDTAFQLSQTYNIHPLELGHVFVLFFYSIIIALIDSTLGDWGIQMKPCDKPCLYTKSNLYVDIDPKVTHSVQRNEYHEQIWKINSLMALEVLERLTENRKATILLQSVLLNMPGHFNCLLQRIQYLESPELPCSELKLANPVLTKVFANIRRVSDSEFHLNKHQLVGILVDVGSFNSLLRCSYSSCQSSCWVPFDIYMENAMDSKQLPTKSAIDVLTEGIKTLHTFNQASWQETFLALWLSALRLVQRERDPPEGPIPHLEARISVLLSIVPLAIANVLNDEAEHNSSSVQVSRESEFRPEMERKSVDSRKHGLILSVQILGHFSSLLCPPELVVGAANHAAVKAACFIYNSMNGEDGSGTDIRSCGNLRHLIVEACIARKLLDTSVYFWPGYVSTSSVSLPGAAPVEKSPWLAFLEGTPLNDPLINSLMVTPASSLAEIEKLFYIALNGSEMERPAAAKILCSASLSCGWCIQEHVVHYVVKLLLFLVPPSHSGSWGHLVDNISVLTAILLGVSSVDTVHIISFHGLVPTVAASLMPLCEAFGSLKPTLNSTADEPSIYMAFSLAFLFLIRLWKFYRPPLDHCITGGGALGGELTLEYLLSLHNNRVMSFQDELEGRKDSSESAFLTPVYIDSCPKLQAWYCQYKSCVASAISGLSTGNSVHQVADKILSMIYWKMTKGGALSSNSSSTSSNACSPFTSAGEDGYQRPMLSAWEVLEALPFVLEAILTACVHGQLSSRDLTTGLRDLVDFLPASLAAIIGYFSSEVTRGVWKLVPMNGIDWPSPAATLQSVESEIKAILAAVGVDVPNCSSGISPVMLPLPMAALVSLTITFKLEKSQEYIHAVAGAALENCASNCPWPSMPIIGSLWAQKVRRWHNFIVVSCSRSVFRHNKDCVTQLLRSCFSSFLGTKCVAASKLTAESSVNGLLGNINTPTGICPSIAPGFLYLRSCRNILDVQYLKNVIVGLVAEYSHELASPDRLKSSEASLSLATQRAKEVATLGASLLCVVGGIQLVQELYRETIPTWLLTRSDVKYDNEKKGVSHILEGYAMAYLLILSGSIIWGVGAKSQSGALSRRTRNVGVHLEFLAQVMEGKISVSCNPATWRTYVSCLMGLMVTVAPAWIEGVNADTLRSLAHGLTRWREYEIAFHLLQRGGPAAMGPLAELINVLGWWFFFFFFFFFRWCFLSLCSTT